MARSEGSIPTLVAQQVASRMAQSACDPNCEERQQPLSGVRARVRARGSQPLVEARVEALAACRMRTCTIVLGGARSSDRRDRGETR
jgi:hypothetical protein